MSNLNDKQTKAASRYLEHRGYTVLETAWKCPARTCDVIAEDGDAIVFVDVSARRDTDKGSRPSDAAQASVSAARWSPSHGSPSTRTLWTWRYASTTSRCSSWATAER
ncbi:MAG: YraN family protein [Adlercreutzia sp.]